MKKLFKKLFEYYSDVKSLKDLKKEKYKHVFLLLYWPFYGLAFLILERFSNLTYHTVECALDRKIPFCEFFLPAYFFWFIFMFWIVAYGFFFDIPSFEKCSKFIMITYTITVIIYIVFPTKQCLRPDEFARDNFLVSIAKGLYAFDTNTNVCPSIHILGSLATTFTAWHSKRYSTFGWRTAFFIMNLLVCASTVFMKQHSVIDVAAALLISFAAYPFVYRRKSGKTEKQLAYK